MSNVVPLRRAEPPEPAEPLAYSVAQAAELLGLGLGLTYSLVRNGTIPARKLGSRWVIPRAAFRAWLNTTPAHTEKVAS
jgi:excisionase family DNA binding protein